MLLAWIVFTLGLLRPGASSPVLSQRMADAPLISPIAIVSRLSEGSIAGVAGRVTLGTGTLDRNQLLIMVQDATGGIELYNAKQSGQISLGDSVEADGIVETYRGMRELKDARLRVIPSRRRVPNPVRVDADAIASHVGQLVLLEGTVTRGTATENLSLRVRISGKSTEAREVIISESWFGLPVADLGPYEAGDRVRAIGVLARLDSRNGEQRYVLDPRLPTDIQLLGLRHGELTRLRFAALAFLLVLVAVAGWVFTLRAQIRLRTEALHESEERYRKLVDNLPHGVAVCTDGKIVFANVVFAGLAGAKGPEELLGLPISSIVHVGEIAENSNVSRMLSGQNHSSGTETRLMRRDGSHVDVEITRALTTFGGRPATQILAHDITRRLNTDAQLRHAQKMEVVGRLAGGIAHDFNNLLTVISVNADLTLLEMSDDSPHREEIEQIQAATIRAAALTSQLLTFSHKRPLRSVILDLRELIASAQKMLRRLIPENIIFHMDLDPDTPYVEADAGQIEQILMNVTLNARDAMPDGGDLRIATSIARVTETSHPERSQMPPGCYACLSVNDTGTGMDAATLGQVFDPFFTTKTVGSGTGLGLAVVRGIVDQLKGYIAVVSSPGQGTTFDIYLPGAHLDPALGRVKSRAVVAPAATGTVLLAEDESAIRKSVSQMLGREGFNVIEARDGTEALRLLSEHRGEVTLILSDVVMPKMGGRALADSIRKDDSTIKILLMSGYDTDIFGGGRPVESDIAFIQKPFTRLELISCINSLLNPDSSV